MTMELRARPPRSSFLGDQGRRELAKQSLTDQTQLSVFSEHKSEEPSAAGCVVDQPLVGIGGRLSNQCVDGLGVRHYRTGMCPIGPT